MNEGDLIKIIARETEQPAAVARRFLEAFKNAMINQLYDEGKFTLFGLASFTVRNVAERTRRNPQTGGFVQVPAQKRVKFTIQKRLRSTLNPHLK